MSERYLIINADDFGVCEETNEAIERLFNAGRISSSTVMVPGRASRDAINRALKNRKIKMGVHLTLNSDYVNARWSSAAPASTVASLLDDEGKFYHDVNQFYMNAKEREVAVEIATQYSFIEAAGYKPDHADSHCGTLYGLTGRPFLEEAFELCAKYKLPFRFPKSKAFLRNMFRGNVPEAIDEAHTHAVIAAEKLGIQLPDDIITNPFGIKDIGSYENLKSFYTHVVSNIGEGITELFLHPSSENSFYKQTTPEWEKRVLEYRLLMDDDFMNALLREDIQLVSWAEAPFGTTIT